MTPTELGLLGGILLIAVLLVVVLRRTARATTPPPDPRLDHVLERIDRLQQQNAQTTQHAVTLAERTLHLAQAYKDLESLKERTTPLTPFMTETTKSLGVVGQQLQPMSKTIPQTAERIGLVEQRLRLLAKIDHQLGELHGVFRSTTGKGQIGEDAVRRVLAQFPDDAWVEKPDLPTGTADFGVRTPNGLLIPIDSKTGGADDIKGYLECLDAVDQARTAANDDPHDPATETKLHAATKRLHEAQRKINDRVRKSARDIQKYIVPEAQTTPFVLQALPEAVFDAVEPRVRQEASERGVIAVPYDLLHPMASAVRRMQAHHELDVARVSAAVVKVREASHHIEDVVKNQVERAATMAQNGAQAIRQDLNAMHAALLSAEMVEPVQHALAQGGNGSGHGNGNGTGSSA